MMEVHRFYIRLNLLLFTIGEETHSFILHKINARISINISYYTNGKKTRQKSDRRPVESKKKRDIKDIRGSF